MKKWIILAVVIVGGLFLLGTDLFVNRFEAWAGKNLGHSAAPRLTYGVAGYLYMVAQRQARAVELYQKAFQWFPQYQHEPEARYRVGLYYESKKDYANATATYQYIIQKWPDLAEKLALVQRIERFKAYSGGG